MVITTWLRDSWRKRNDVQHPVVDGCVNEICSDEKTVFCLPLPLLSLSSSLFLVRIYVGCEVDEIPSQHILFIFMLQILII